MQQASRDRHRRVGPWVALVLLALMSLTGCVRIQGALAMSQDDLVSGDVVIATVQGKQDDVGPVLTVAPELSGKVRTEKYAVEGYVGQKLIFSGLTFSEMARLAESINTSKQYRLTFRRSGDLVSMAGSIDLTQVSVDRADVQVRIAFPGTITRTNGINDSGTISWEPKPGAVTEFNATAQYTDTSGVSWTRWVMIVGGSAIGVALIVLLLALFTHRRTLKQINAERAQAS